jgi:phosphinothricin acetyltransferase
MNIRQFEPADFDRVQDIYQQGIDTGHATFQQQQKNWQQWQQSMIESMTLVITEQGNNQADDLVVMGWAGLSAISSREVYAGVAEVSIYMSPEVAGKGYGSQLFKALIERSEARGFWTLQSAIFPENKGSIKLHEKLGFRLIGERKALGKMHGVWRDVWLYERRSEIAGV